MPQEIQKILVTGSSGTIGTRLCELLLEQEYSIVGFDREPNKWNAEIEEKTIRGDLRETASLADIPKDIDCIIHLAANARVYKLVENPQLAQDNVETTFNILDFARQHNISRFLFGSSREVYGNSDKAVHEESELSVERCEAPYTASKIAGESLVHAFQQCYGIDFVILRFSNVYGMYDDTDRLIPLFFQLAKEDKELIVFGKEKLLDFTYIDDAVSGVIKAIEKFSDAKNDTYNIATGAGTPITRVAEYMKALLKSDSQIVVKTNRPGEVVQFIANISKAKEKLGYDPQISIEDGLRQTVQWYEEKTKL